MYKLESINNSNLAMIDKFNLNEEYLNELIDICSNKNIIKKLLLSKNIKYIKDDSKYIGFMWYSKYYFKGYKLHCIKLGERYHTLDYYRYIFDNFEDSNDLIVSDNNNLNKDLMLSLDFTISRSIIEMYLKDIKSYGEELNKDITFRNFIDGSDEKVRCSIQNSVFQSINRQAIEIEDVIYEKLQSYYIKEGCIFINVGGNDIGYGQLVKKDNRLYIANFGILPQYRSKGYGRALIRRILTVAKDLGFKEVYLRVDLDNKDAIALYKGEGFAPMKEYHQFKKRRENIDWRVSEKWKVKSEGRNSGGVSSTTLHFSLLLLS